MRPEISIFPKCGEVIEKERKREKYIRCGRFDSSRNLLVEKCPLNTLNLQSLQSFDLKPIDPSFLS